MTLTHAIKTCFGKYADFSGRAQRSEFWWWVLFSTVSHIILGLIPFIGLIVILGLLVPNLAVTTRRLHDTGRSAGWLLLFPISILGLVISMVVLLIGVLLYFNQDTSKDLYLFLVMIVSFAIGIGCSILLLVLCVLPGTVGPNRYGPDPLRPEPVMGGYGESSYDSAPSDPLSEQEPERRQFCSQCGMKLPQDAQFCADCGTAG